MYFKKILFLLIFLFPIFCYPCDCAFKNIINPSLEVQQNARESSECILTGKISNVNTREQTFEITVIESLDGGDIQGNSYIGKGWKKCFPYITEESTWLIYGYTENGYLRPNICGLSRSFDTFSASNQTTINNKNTEGIVDSLYVGIGKDFLKSLYFEIKALREYKRKKLSENNPNY